MSVLLLRGRTLSFRDLPQSHDDEASHAYEEDGAVAVKDGLIAASGSFDQVSAQYPSADVVDHRPHLILPGFIDTHLHFPQGQVIGSFGTKLLDWLNTYTFVEEQKFADPGHCKRMATHFFDNLLRNGTTTAVAYCSVHKASAEAFFTEAAHRNLRMIGGKVMMDRNAPDALCDTPQSAYDDSRDLIDRWHGKGRALYAISPRFAITSTPTQLEMAQALKTEFPGCYLQTHLSENHAEIDLTLDLYQSARDYLDVYQMYDLLGDRSLFGHCLHLNGRERAAMAGTGSVAVFCPTSNLFLGSGLFDEDGLREHGVRTAIATDIGGGTSYSMLKTLDEAYKVLQLKNQVLNPLKSFFMMTLGNARALQLEHEIGTLEEGSEADLVVLNSQATAAMALRMETVRTLSEELFVLQTMADDRAIAGVYAAGRACHPDMSSDSGP
ncbi:MAG: guanine deaminase [Pseudomonadota bacterium]